MVSRLALVLCAALLAALFASPAQGRAKDAVVARDTLIRQIWPLDGDLVYLRLGTTPLKRALMVRYHGHLHRAHGIPQGAGVGQIGRDAHGRKVFTFATGSTQDGSVKWFVYDLARDSVRPLSVPATDCPIDWLAIWRDTTAYTTSCQDSAKSEMFLKHRSDTQRAPRDTGGFGPVFRDGTIASLWEDGNDNMGVAQYFSHGTPCPRILGAAIGDATDETGWFPTQVQILGGYLVWTMGDPFLRRDFAILAAKVARGCGSPGSVGVFPFKPQTARVQALAVDNRRVFYADGKTLRKHVLPARPSSDPPPNDEFKHARKLSGDAPRTASGHTAHATVQSGEPLADAQHTVWYAFRPKTTRRAYVTVTPSCSDEPPDTCSGAYRYGVYTGSSPTALTQLPKTHYPSAPYNTYTRVDAVAGKTYWISVGSSFDQNYQPLTVRIARKP